MSIDSTLAAQILSFDFSSEKNFILSRLKADTTIANPHYKIFKIVTKLLRNYASENASGDIIKKFETGQLGSITIDFNDSSVVVAKDDFDSILNEVIVAEIGISEDTILIGSSAALGGPNGFIGTEFHKGARIYFDYINKSGGIYGKKIEVKIIDDGYEPVRTIYNTKNLIKKDKVFCLFGYIGTPTTYSIRPTIEKEKIPLFSAFTGAEGLRKPVLHYMLNVRCSYYQETGGLVDHLLNDCGSEKIACFYQNDAYGKAGYLGVKLGLEKYGRALCGEGTYKRNTVNVTTALDSIKPTTPDAIIMIGQYTACAAFIKKAKKSGMLNVKYCNISFVGSDKLNSLLGDDAEGCICSQTVPALTNENNILTTEFLSKYKSAYSEDVPNRVAYEGYISSLLFVEGLKRSGFTREGFINAVERIKKLDIGIDEMVNYGKYDHQGLDKVYYSIVQNGEEIALTDWCSQ